VKLISYKVADDVVGSVSLFNDFIGQFSQSPRPSPHKSADFNDRLTSPLVDWWPVKVFAQ